MSECKTKGSIKNHLETSFVNNLEMLKSYICKTLPQRRKPAITHEKKAVTTYSPGAQNDDGGLARYVLEMVDFVSSRLPVIFFMAK